MDTWSEEERQDPSLGVEEETEDQEVETSTIGNQEELTDAKKIEINEKKLKKKKAS